MASADTTKLGAINSMLALTGEDAVNSLTTNLSAEVALAIRTLDEANLNLQSRGWHWNTFYKVTITPDANSRFVWQADWLKVDTDPGKYRNVDLVRQGGFLHNRYKDSNVVAKSSLEVTLTRFIDWEDLPEEARQYLRIKASRVFAYQALGDELRSGYAKVDEDDAMELLITADTEQADYNFEAQGTPAEAHRLAASRLFEYPSSL